MPCTNPKKSKSRTLLQFPKKKNQRKPSINEHPQAHLRDISPLRDELPSYIDVLVPVKFDAELLQDAPKADGHAKRGDIDMFELSKTLRSAHRQPEYAHLPSQTPGHSGSVEFKNHSQLLTMDYSSLEERVMAKQPRFRINFPISSAGDHANVRALPTQATLRVLYKAWRQITFMNAFGTSNAKLMKRFEDDKN